MTLRLDEPFRWGMKAATPEIKAVTVGTAWSNAVPLSSMMGTPQQRAAAYLRAYKVGWFYKAEHKIADDIANLSVSVAPEDTEGDNEAAVIEPDLFTPWERLDPIGQFLRLMERPNPNQTGRQLRAKTQIRIDMAGTAFWYMEGGEQGLPTAIYGISPSRMWDSRDREGNLIGWVMDKDTPTAVPFTPEEILVFATASTEDGSPWGVGVVEAVFSELPLSDMMARHTTDLLQTGGRLAGMMWPKERTLGENEYLDAQRAWRNVASDPNAARRMLLFPEPMEWAPGASTPADIGIPELAALNRDNILTAFPISPYMLGVPLPGGMNASGEIRREEKLSYQEGTIHPRVELFEETVQVGLLSRYEAIMGSTYDFEVAEPNLDTAPALIEKVGALKALIAAGFDDKEAVAAVGLDHIKYNGPPAPVVPPAPEEELPVSATAQPGDPAQVGPQSIVKAVDVEGQRDGLLHQTEAQAKSALATFLDEQRDRVSDAIRAMPKSKAARKADPGDWWDADRENAELRAVLENVYVQVGRQGLQAVADNLNRVVTKQVVKPVVDDILAYGGDRITAINEVTQQAVKAEIAEGVRRGYSVNQLIDGVPDENFGGIKGLTLDNGAPAFSDLRAETIARTETMLSYNRSSVTGYGAFGVERLLAYDGDGDAECAARAGNEYAIDEALGIEDHPNGTLVWSPVIEKAVDVEDERSRWAYDAAMKAIDALSRQPEIHVHHAVSPPDVHVDIAPTTVPVTVEAAEVIVPPTVVNVTVPEMEPAQVTVHVPEQASPVVNVTVPEVVLPEVAPPNVQVDVHVPEPKPVTKTIKRDKSGAITRIEES